MLMKSVLFFPFLNLGGSKYQQQLNTIDKASFQGPALQIGALSSVAEGSLQLYSLSPLKES